MATLSAPVQPVPSIHDNNQPKPVSRKKKSAIKQYECMFVLNANKFNADHDAVTAHVLELVEKGGGKVIAHRPWQEGKLAYEIDGHRKGVHYLVMFETESTTLNTDLDRGVKLSEFILRHLVIRPPAEIFEATVAGLGGEGPLGDSDEEESESKSEKPAETEAEAEAEAKPAAVEE